MKTKSDVIYRVYAYFCSMNYKEHKDNPKSFRALTGLTHIQFSHFRSFCIYKNSPLPDVSERLFFILVYLKNNPQQEYHAACFDMDQKHCNIFVLCLTRIFHLGLETMGLVPAQTDKELSKRLS